MGFQIFVNKNATPFIYLGKLYLLYFYQDFSVCVCVFLVISLKSETYSFHLSKLATCKVYQIL